jgi:hypothetical protein
MEILSSIFTAVLVASLGYLIWNLQQLTKIVAELKQEWNNRRVEDAGAAVSCRAKHERLDEVVEDHEVRIKILETPIKKNILRR